MRPWLNHHQQLQKLFLSHFGTEKEFVGVDIGTYCGDSVRAILWAMPNCKMIYTIDPWVHVDGGQFESGELQPYHNKNKELALSKFQAEDIKDRVTVLEMTSQQAYQHLTETLGLKEFDFVWVDGSHEKKDVIIDLDLYGPLVKEGGIFGGHDFGQIPEVTYEIFCRFDKHLNSGNDYVWWVYK